MSTNAFKYVVEFTVAKVWIEDGFDLTDNRARNMLATDLDFAHIENELDARVISAPSAIRIARTQGYKNAETVTKDRIDGQLHDPVNLLKTLQQAFARLDSVAFLSKEGDTDSIKKDLAFFIDLFEGKPSE